MAWLGVPQTQFEANYIDNAWLGSCLKAFEKALEQMMLMTRGLPRSGNGFQRDLVANDAAAWLGSLLNV